MTVELRALFDGEVAGLSEHRLSLAAFGEALPLLLNALQRTASGLITSALEDPEYGTRGGILAKEAKLLDLELVAVNPGCAEPHFVCTTRQNPWGQISLVDTLPADAVTRLVRDIEAEAGGRLRNGPVRAYLRSLPSGITRQRYAAVVDGKEVCTAEFGQAELSETPRGVGRLVLRRGRVVAVSFEPPNVKIKLATRTISLDATEAQVDCALANRQHEVAVAYVDDGNASRVIWLRAGAGQRPPSSLEDTVKHLKAEWPETLRILAQ